MIFDKYIKWSHMRKSCMYGSERVAWGDSCFYSLKMYEEECNKNNKLLGTIETMKLDNSNLKYELRYLKSSVENKIEVAIKKAVAPLEEQVKILQEELKLRDNEIDRLKNIVNKNSTNSSKAPSTDFNESKKVESTSANEYNYRTKSNKKSGGQVGHQGHNLSKEKIENSIKQGKMVVKEFVHYINGNKEEDDIVKYRVGLKIISYVEKHIFKHTPKSKETLPKEFYTDVTYNNDIKTLIVELGEYNTISYERIRDLINALSKDVITLTDGSINNFYQEFSEKSEPTLGNITDNLLSCPKMLTDETSSKENGKKIYFRGYGNDESILYKFHDHKGHEPIKEGDILTRYISCIVGDHDTTLYQYGTSHQECNVHTGRYLEEIKQNCLEINWQYEMYELLFRLNQTRKIAKEYGLTEFDEKDLVRFETEYDNILERAIVENEEISSSYYKPKAERLRRKLKKYKEAQLYFLHDFNIPFDDNAIERDLRMIKNKTKISGGFRSESGGKNFAAAMSIIKTSRKRGINPFNSIIAIFNNEVLFAN